MHATIRRPIPPIAARSTPARCRPSAMPPACIIPALALFAALATLTGCRVSGNVDPADLDQLTLNTDAAHTTALRSPTREAPLRLAVVRLQNSKPVHDQPTTLTADTDTGLMTDAFRRATGDELPLQIIAPIGLARAYDADGKQAQITAEAVFDSAQSQQADLVIIYSLGAREREDGNGLLLLLSLGLLPVVQVEHTSTLDFRLFNPAGGPPILTNQSEYSAHQPSNLWLYWKAFSDVESRAKSRTHRETANSVIDVLRKQLGIPTPHRAAWPAEF